MNFVLSVAGLNALTTLERRQSALVFDLDGTLAPLTTKRDDAEVPAATAARMRDLCRSWSIAVITGRSVVNAAARLGFEPRCLVGNHGAERRGLGGQESFRSWQRTLDPVRERLQLAAGELEERGIEVEDKCLSIALHYRASTDPVAALAAAHAIVIAAAAGVRINEGHHVVNITPLNPPDKGDALRGILEEWGLTCALVIGDDSNDEPAFLKAPSGSVTVRIGPMETPTAANFSMEFQSEIDELLQVLLGLRRN